MRRFFRGFAMILVVWIGSNSGRTGQAQESFTLDNVHTSIIFSISHFKIGYVFGRFNLCAGKVLIDGANPDASTFSFSIATHSIDTNDDTRDTILKSIEFFDIEQFPNIDFSSTKVREADGKYEVTGIIKMRGREKVITIPLQLLGVGEGPMGKTRMGMIGKFRLKRSDFGMEKMLQNLGDEIAVTFSFEAIKDE